MPGRPTKSYEIVSRYGVPSDVAAPEDFTLALTAERASAIVPANGLAYCADLTAERVLFTHHETAELEELFAAPFLFVEQLRRATGVTTVPFEDLAGLALAEPGMRPVLVFSPGRSGSTLFAKLLAASGVGCASEPDMLTQIGRADPQAWAGLPPGTDALLAGTCIGALCRVLGQGAVIKLRGWCNARPIAMVRSFPGCRVVFMLRGMAGWAMSRHRTFQETPDAVAAELCRALDALDLLAGAGVAAELLWYEDLIADPQAVLALLDASVPSQRLGQIMREDSQAGSWIARRIVERKPVQSGFLEEFAARWAAIRKRAAWSASTEALLQRMWDR